MKDNFLLRKSQREVFDTLTDEEAGILIKGIFKYLDTNDSGLTGMLKAIFIPIKNDIDKNEEKYQKKCEILRQNRNQPDISMKSDRNHDEISSDNNHISYITNHNSFNQEDKKKDIRGMGEEEKGKETVDNSSLLEISKKAINYLNEKTDSKFKYSSKSNQTKINARLNEGYNLDDFIVVIDKKVKEWTGTEFEKFLCPETLFGTKFEKYLNQKSTQPQRKETKPDWFDKDIKNEPMTEEDIKEIDEILNSIEENVSKIGDKA